MFFRASSSRDREDHLALGVALSGSFVRFASLGKRERAVDDDANGTRIEQASNFHQLRTARLDLRCRNREAELLSLFGSGKVQGEDREQSAATLERAQETTSLRTANGVDDEIDTTDDILGSGLCVIDHFVGTEVAHERLVLA